jgi:hypothetical protein
MRKITLSVGKPASILTSSHCPLWSNVRFASPPVSKEYER